ncbi:putative transcription factor C2H2 family [Helianthus annuus]|uniref:Putative zinc finger, C2H2 n=1 Tax=Helianthus annuus TaxID=4232 RepID=A0A251S4A4_HELAN|nr:putative transcription factor C2H2 family [Helianthus annuus]KAJ0567829.1 putative transcription factor C2H2 family [Helianthus annuus]KAJ0574281.1 putative transcription factor C2H2 family [Helianthus annuus]KAJ0738616.1 putative transcription factor C2H2 family [Helianthus annuus]KAJ0741495.1 putative transcription factor C2H2 family [Helianthus annuus]
MDLCVLFFCPLVPPTCNSPFYSSHSLTAELLIYHTGERERNGRRRDVREMLAVAVPVAETRRLPSWLLRQAL